MRINTYIGVNALKYRRLSTTIAATIYLQIDFNEVDPLLTVINVGWSFFSSAFDRDLSVPKTDVVLAQFNWVLETRYCTK